MRTTANKYVLQIDNWDNDSASAYKNVTLLANLINVERQKDIFDMVKNTLSKKNGELFDVATHNLAHLFSKIRTKTILYEMYKTDIGSLLNIDRFFSDYARLKNANDVVIVIANREARIMFRCLCILQFYLIWSHISNL